MYDLMQVLLKCCLLIVTLSYVYSQDLAIVKPAENLCVGRTVTLKCDPTANTDYTIAIDEAFYAINGPSTIGCTFNIGDCRENTKITPTLYSASYSFTASQLITLSSCGSKKAEYLHIRYQCIPHKSKTIQTYNVCDNGDVTSDNGFITSPNYPSNAQIPNQCVKKIQAPNSKVIKLRFLDIQMKNPENNKCPTDFVNIIDSTGTYTNCGTDRPSYESRLCSSVVYVAFQQPTNVFLGKGFKLYYEFVDRSTQPDCSTATPTAPPIPTTPAVTTPEPVVITDLIASPISTAHVCRGTALGLTPYKGYYIFVLDAFYGVPGSLSCEAYSQTHCNAPANINCPYDSACTLSLLSDVPVPDCSYQLANYLEVKYRFLPVLSTKNFSICDGGDVSGSQYPYGIITSRNYPNWEANVNCGKRIVAPTGNIIKVFFTDLSIDNADESNQCTSSYVSVTDNGKERRYCGTRGNGIGYWYSSCSNTLDISYKSSSQNANYKGFNMYYEVMDGTGITCPGVIVIPTTTTTTASTSPGSTTQQPAVSTITSQILTEGGNAFGKPCVFPFKYNGQQYDQCINVGQPQYWCATTNDYDRDNERGNCKLGLTTTVAFDLCPGNKEVYNCPKGYLSYIISAEFGVTSDGSCSYNKVTCRQSAMTSVKSTAGLQSSNVVHNQRNLDQCGNQKSNILHIEFACVPDTAPGYDSYTIGNTQTITATKGLILTPGYPSYQANLNAQTKILVSGNNKFVNIYNVNTYLISPTISGVCQADKLTIVDNVQDPLTKCGNEKSDLFFQTCSNQITIGIQTGTSGSSLYKGSKLYFEVIDKSADALCPSTTLPTTPGTGTTGTTSTTTKFLPSYVLDGISSPINVKATCSNSIFDLFSPTKLTCPTDYIIAIRRSFYGISKTNECSFKDGDCVSYKDNPATNNCAGKETCSYLDFGTNLPECDNKKSTYLQVEYDCIPISLPAKPMCGQTFTDKNGIIKSPNYPTYDYLQNCPVTITTTTDKVIKAYIIDMSINDNCDTDNIVLYDPFNITSASYCGQQNAILAIETCLSTLTINLVSKGSSDPAYRGVLLYYEAIPKPQDPLFCFTTTPTTRPTTTTTRTTTTPTTTSTRPSNYGLALNVMQLTTCQSTSISCPNDYVIILISAEYATNDVASIGCAYSPTDCFETTSSFNLGCSGKQSCNILYSTRTLSTCDRRTSKYLYMTYQCVPAVNAGFPTTNPTVEICSGGGADGKITVDSSIMVRSPNYPSYPATDSKCIKQIKTVPGKALNVYLIAAGFKGTSSVNCVGNNDYLKVSDCAQSAPPQCGSSLYGRLLLQSVSNEITVDFSITGSTPNILLKGFQMYIEAVPSNTTCDSVTEPPSQTTTGPATYLGFVSPTYHTEICVQTERTLQCPNDYYVLVEEEHFVSTGAGCTHSQNECKQPTDLAYQKCSSQQKCMVFVANTPLPNCPSKFADLLDIEHVCLPASIPSLKTYSCTDRRIEGKNGFIQSPGYPSYTTGVQNCEMEINAAEGYMIKIYIVDFLLADRTDDGNCTDYLRISEDAPYCSYDQPRLIHTSFGRRGARLNFKSLPQGANADGLRGFKLYFEETLFRDPNATTTTTTTTTRSRGDNINYQTKIIHSSHSSSLTGWSLGLGIPLIIAVAFGALWLIRKRNMNGYQNFPDSSVNTTVNYSKKNNNEIEDVKSFENPNFAITNSVNASSD